MSHSKDDALQADVVVVGAGNAALCAALSARESGARVIVLESAPQEEAGGNSRFTAGAMRFVYRGAADLQRIAPDLGAQELAQTDFGQYTQEQFFDDMFKVTRYRTDPQLVDLLVRGSFDAVDWLRSRGIRFVPRYGHQATKVGDRFKFWGGLTMEVVGGGPGLVDGLMKAAAQSGITVHFATRAVSLLMDGVHVRGVRARQGDRMLDIRAGAVVLAAGGFQANTEWRTRYLGPGWEFAKIRGSRFNNGDGIRMALEIGASSHGHWSGCHAVGWDRNAPEHGDLAVGDGFQKHSYPLGIMVNADGERFVDEGFDFHNYTYAKYGEVVLRQPGQFAWQVFDSKVTSMLRAEYRIKEATRVKADSLEELAGRLEGVNATRFLETVASYNRSVMTERPFDPHVRDGRATRGLAVPKSNWANPIVQPPFEAYAVTCGITFTYGGLRIDSTGQVLDMNHVPIPGLFAAGEMVGGLFYFNYPGGTGLTAGAVFGRLAGRSSAAMSKALA